jgi:2'-5' RNA ligase
MAQPDYSGHSMLAVYPPPALARKLAIPGGLPPEDLHVTIAYTGLAAGVDRKQLRKTAKKLADRSPVTGTVSGHARFTSGDKDVIVAVVDSPALDELRASALGELNARGVAVPRNHGYTAHMTLAYVGKDDPDPVGRLTARPVTFAAVTAKHGGTRKDRPFDNSLAEAAREAFVTGWALSGGPVTEAVGLGAEAAVQVALEHARDPHVLEATLNIGKLKGLWALFFARREQIIATGTSTVRKAWQTIAGEIGVMATVDRLIAELGPAGYATAGERIEAAAAAASSLMSAMYAAAEHGDLQAAMTDAILAGMAEGQAGVLALNAEQAGYTVVADLAKDAGATDSQVFSIELAYERVYASLASLPDLPLMADGWIQRIIGGAANDVGKLLARLLAEQATRKDMIRALTDALDADETASASARALALFMDQAISQAMSRSAIQLYQSEDIADIYFVTAGDDRVCPLCEEAQENSPYAPGDAPTPGLHPLCRCVLTSDDPAPFKALAGLLT